MASLSFQETSLTPQTTHCLEQDAHHGFVHVGPKTVSFTTRRASLWPCVSPPQALCYGHNGHTGYQRIRHTSLPLPRKVSSEEGTKPELTEEVLKY